MKHLIHAGKYFFALLVIFACFNITAYAGYRVITCDRTDRACMRELEKYRMQHMREMKKKQYHAKKHQVRERLVRQYFPSKIKPSGRAQFVFSPALLRWAAYDKNGNLIRLGRGSGGNVWCSDVGRPCRTPQGTFSVYHKGSASCKSSKYPVGKGGAPMPHCMFFHRGFAIHGSYDLPDFNASHGCIRVHPDEAAWLHRNFIQPGTIVKVTSYRL